jgi:monoamine oxidase
MLNKELTRRDWIVGTASAAALAGCAGAKTLVPSDPSFAQQSTDPDAAKIYDVIVVGGGSAGIGAARTVQSYKRSILVLEAQGRFGGRALTDNTTFSEVGFDLGAQFFGHCISGNVLYGIAQEKGIRVVDFSTLPTYFYLGTKEAPDAQVASFVATFGGMLTDLLTDGALIATPRQDYPASRITNKYRKDPWYQNAIGVVVTTESGAEPAQSSTLDLYNFTVGSPSPFTTPGDSFVCKSGMGNFIQSLGKGLPVKFNTRVKRITRNASGVTIETSNGTYRARTAVVTVSTGVLGAGAIEFRPLLPAATRNAIAALPLGLVYKCALGFNKRYLSSVQG